VPTLWALYHLVPISAHHHEISFSINRFTASDQENTRELIRSLEKQEVQPGSTCPLGGVRISNLRTFPVNRPQAFEADEPTNRDLAQLNSCQFHHRQESFLCRLVLICFHLSFLQLLSSGFLHPILNLSLHQTLLFGEITHQEVLASKSALQLELSLASQIEVQ
jgi:hypothetical protein